MTAPAATVPPTATVTEAARRMHTARVRWKASRRSSLIPYLVRAVHHVEGVVRVENKLSFDVDDYDPAMAYPWMRP